MAKEKKSSTIVSGFEMNGAIFTRSKLIKVLFEEVNKKFNPLGLNEKIIKFDGVQVQFQEFRRALSWLNDKKAHAIDGLPAQALKRIGY